ncbi:MAG: hypothetical protein AB7V55_03245 [Oscillospiraceae bacterium]|jgi:hypothetical protein
MRIRYIGQDDRLRVAEANRVKFLVDGFKAGDKQAEWDDRLTGPVIVVHVYRSKGGKRLTLQVPDDYDMEAAQMQLLEKGWLDLTCCPVKMENLY